MRTINPPITTAPILPGSLFLFVALYIVHYFSSFPATYPPLQYFSSHVVTMCRM